MNHYSEDYLVQRAANICLYNLTRKEFASKIHASILSKIIASMLGNMKRFSKKYELQKNMLVMLWDRRYILKKVSVLFYLHICYFKMVISLEL